jgi:hypothetical protein
VEIKPRARPDAELDQRLALQHLDDGDRALCQHRGCDGKPGRFAQRPHLRADRGGGVKAVTHRLAQRQHLHADLVAVGDGVLARIAALDEGAEMPVGAGLGDAELARHLADAARAAAGGQVLEQAEHEVDRLQFRGDGGGLGECVHWLR